MYADSLHLDRLCSESDVVSIEGSDDEYVELKLRCRGLMESGGRIRYTVNHVAGLSFPADYPLVAPVVEWRTPLFHPNILGSNHSHHPGATCLGIWSPSVGIESFIEVKPILILKSLLILKILSPMIFTLLRSNSHPIKFLSNSAKYVGGGLEKKQEIRLE